MTDNQIKSLEVINNRKGKKSFITFLKIMFVLLIVLMFLPWTQNIRSHGVVTALRPEQRPQTIHSIIPGRIEKWYVQEGQSVKKGDTIMQISEVKSEYLNPDLVTNTEQQLKAKNFSVQSYMDKLNAIDAQIGALISSRKQKYEQAQNKLLQAQLKYRNDSIEFSAIKLNEKIAEEQLKRMEELYKEGLKSLTELETRRSKFQETQVKSMSQLNKILTSRNEVLNAGIELQNVNAEFSEKISKLESEKNSAFSGMYDAEAAVTKLQNDVANYSIRSGMYFITAPQDGYVTKALKSGIGEIIKEGTDLVSIVPKKFDLAVEMYVYPMDIPLLGKGQSVRIQFDGWPSIVFSGWPTLTYGTFGGKIVAIDNFISENGKYRVLVAEDANDYPWPEQIKLGAGAGTLTLLKDVPVWYEMWRQINGFPPDFYKRTEKNKSEKK